MPRMREFDSAKALNAATEIFWHQGYKKASVQALMKAMKLGESSFYNTYKSKKNLYMLCLQHYNDRVTSKRLQALKTSEPIGDKIRHFFDSVIDDQMKSKGSKGCLMTNSLSYEVLNDKELRRYVEHEIEAIRLLFISLFEKAKVGDELEHHFDSHTVADLLITHLQGVFKMSLVQKDFSQLKHQITVLIKSLGL